MKTTITSQCYAKLLMDKKLAAAKSLTDKIIGTLIADPKYTYGCGQLIADVVRDTIKIISDEQESV